MGLINNTLSWAAELGSADAISFLTWWTFTSLSPPGKRCLTSGAALMSSAGEERRHRRSGGCRSWDSSPSRRTSNLPRTVSTRTRPQPGTQTSSTRGGAAGWGSPRPRRRGRGAARSAPPPPWAGGPAVGRAVSGRGGSSPPLTVLRVSPALQRVVCKTEVLWEWLTRI